MRVFRLREWTIFGRSLLKFSPKFSQNARSILKFNMWSITQVVVRGRTRNAIGRETGARVRLPDAPPNRMDRWILFVCPFFFAGTSPVYPVFGAYGIMLTHCHSPALPASPVQTRAWKRNRGGRKYWRWWRSRCAPAIPESASWERRLPEEGWRSCAVTV